MESAWKRKCDSPFQPSTSAAVPSAPVPEPEPVTPLSSSVLLLFELFLLFEYVTRNVLCTGD